MEELELSRRGNAEKKEECWERVREGVKPPLTGGSGGFPQKMFKI